MSFMELYLTQKGALYSADCSRCGRTLYAHEWASPDHNEDRDALQAGTARCPDCDGTADAATFHYCGRQYAGRYSANGYLDCTEWEFSPNKRRLERDLRAQYGDDD